MIGTYSEARCTRPTIGTSNGIRRRSWSRARFFLLIVAMLVPTTVDAQVLAELRPFVQANPTACRIVNGQWVCSQPTVTVQQPRATNRVALPQTVWRTQGQSRRVVFPRLRGLLRRRSARLSEVGRSVPNAAVSTSTLWVEPSCGAPTQPLPPNEGAISIRQQPSTITLPVSTTLAQVHEWQPTVWQPTVE